MFIVFKREVKSYFLYSPLGYVFIAAFFILFGIFFMAINIGYGITDINITLSNMSLVLLFLIPALTMRLIAEERKTKTDQLLFTSPISPVKIVLGKFLAATCVFIITLLITLIYAGMLSIFSTPNIPGMINAYIGFLFLGISFISICVFASALTDNQVIAFIIGFSSILVLWILEFLENLISNQVISKIIDWVSLLKRYKDFSDGILKPAPIIYYISVIALFVFLTMRAIEKRRWSEGGA